MKKICTFLILIVWIVSFFAGFCIKPDTLRSLNIWTFFPVILLLATAISTKSYYVSFFFSTLLALTYIYKLYAPSIYVDILVDVCSKPDNIWLLLDIMMIGGLISVIERSGIAEYMANWFSNNVKTEKMELGVILLLSFLLSFDDYFCPSMVSSVFKKNKNKCMQLDSAAFISRGATIAFANYNPVSWPIYTMGLLVTYEVADSMDVYTIYYKISLLMFFPISLIIILLIKLLRLPQEGLAVRCLNFDKAHLKMMVYLFVPVILHMALSLIVGDTLKPLILTTLLTSILHACRGCYEFAEIPNVIISGVKHMLEVCVVIVMSLIFSEALNQIFFIDHSITIISLTSNYKFIPVFVFMFFSLTEYMFSLNWSLWLIIFPVLIRVCEVTGANLPLTLGAILSAGILGSISCIYSDSCVLSIANFSLDVRRHAQYTFFHILPPVIISAMLYLLLGVML